MVFTPDSFVDMLNEHIEGKHGQIISWRDISELTKRHMALPADFNWLRARDVLMRFIDIGYLTRTDDLRVEEYKINLMI
jgi:hypothetical protein